MDENSIERKIYINYGNDIKIDDLKNIVDHTHKNIDVLDRITEEMLNRWEFDINLDDRIKALEEKDAYLSNKLSNDISTINIRIDEEVTEINNTILQEKKYLLSEIDKVREQLGLDTSNISNQLIEIDNKINQLEKSVSDIYATKTELKECQDKLDTHTHSYLTLTDRPTIPSIDGLASEDYVLQKIEEARLGSNIVLSNYATKDDLLNKSDVGHTHNYNDLENIPSDIATEEYVQNAIEDFRLTQGEIDLSDYATISYVDIGLDGKADIEHTHDNFATKIFVINKIAEAQLSGGDGNVDLSGFATKDDLELKADKEHTHEEMQEMINSFDYRLEEVKSSVSNGKKLLADALTDRGINTSANESFESMANKILMLCKYQPKPSGINLVTRNGISLVTRDNKYITIIGNAEEKPSGINLVTRNGISLVTRDNKYIITKNNANDEEKPSGINLVTRDGISIVTRDNKYIVIKNNTDIEGHCEFTTIDNKIIKTRNDKTIIRK